MPKPQNKTELLNQGAANFQKLFDHIEALSEQKQNQVFPGGYLNRNVRDVLAHIHEWHQMLLGWHEVGMTGEKPSMPALGYTWKTLPLLNQEIQKRYANTTLSEAKELITGSHDVIRSIIAQHTNEELFEKKRYPWTNSTSMGAYFISATASHYDWGLKLIKKCLKG